MTLATRTATPRRALRLGLDLDGVFSDFCTSAVATIAELTGRALAPTQVPYYPAVWDFFRALGYRKTEIDKFWAHVAAEPAWWLGLAAYPGTNDFLAWLEAGIESQAIEVYFLTQRPAHNAHWQSAQWLRDHGITQPQVIVTRDATSKGQIAAGLALDCYADDYADNLRAVKAHSRHTAVALYVQPWGRAEVDLMLTAGAHCHGTLHGLRTFVRRYLADPAVSTGTNAPGE